MKRITLFAGLFALSFCIGIGSVLLTAGPANAARCILPCTPAQIVCTDTPCEGLYGMGAIFYCCIEGECTPYCSQDFRCPIPCQWP
jgi:hypothetical protein